MIKKKFKYSKQTEVLPLAAPVPKDEIRRQGGCTRLVSGIGQIKVYCQKNQHDGNHLGWCQECASRLPFWPPY